MDVFQSSFNWILSSIGFSGDVFTSFVSPFAIACYIAVFAIYTVYRLILRPLIGAGSSDIVKGIRGKNKKSKSKDDEE